MLTWHSWGPIDNHLADPSPAGHDLSQVRWQLRLPNFLGKKCLWTHFQWANNAFKIKFLGGLSHKLQERTYGTKIWWTSLPLPGKPDVSKSRQKGWVGLCPHSALPSIYQTHTERFLWAGPGLVVGCIGTWSIYSACLVGLSIQWKTFWIWWSCRGSGGYRSTRQELLIQTGQVSEGICQGWFVLGFCRETKVPYSCGTTLALWLLCAPCAVVDLVWLCHRQDIGLSGWILGKCIKCWVPQLSM